MSYIWVGTVGKRIIGNQFLLTFRLHIETCNKMSKKNQRHIIVINNNNDYKKANQRCIYIILLYLFLNKDPFYVRISHAGYVTYICIHIPSVACRLYCSSCVVPCGERGFPGRASPPSVWPSWRWPRGQAPEASSCSH